MEFKDPIKSLRIINYMHDRWPLLSDKDLIFLEKHPENLVIKLQRHYHLNRKDAYTAYFELKNFEDNLMH